MGEITVSGETKRLDRGRSVFVGRSADDPGFTFIRFVSEQGEENKFKLTDEAAEALKDLLMRRNIRGAIATWVNVALDRFPESYEEKKDG